MLLLNYQTNNRIKNRLNHVKITVTLNLYCGIINHNKGFDSKTERQACVIRNSAKEPYQPF